METFVLNAQATLGKAAASIEEIGSARQAAKALMSSLPRIMDYRCRIDEKNRLMKTAAGSGATTIAQTVDMTDVDNAWESFTAQLQQHDARLDEQKGQLQGQLQRQVRYSSMPTPSLHSHMRSLSMLEQSSEASCQLAMCVSKCAPGSHGLLFQRADWW